MFVVFSLKNKEEEKRRAEPTGRKEPNSENEKKMLTLEARKKHSINCLDNGNFLLVIN